MHEDTVAMANEYGSMSALNAQRATKIFELQAKVRNLESELELCRNPLVLLENE